MQWISVKERLPERDTTVLVAMGGCVTIADWYMNSGWSFDREDTALFPSRIVTHWMPLPDAPVPEEPDVMQ
jgi:hypothetical protein